jgi:hypothetical protein
MMMINRSLATDNLLRLGPIHQSAAILEHKIEC